MDLSREHFLKTPVANLTPVEIPEFGGTVYLRAPSAFEMDSWDKEQLRRKADNNKHLHNLRTRVAIFLCCDKDGNKLFTGADEDALSHQPTAALDRILKAARPLLGWSDEVTEKNSETTTKDDSDTD